MTQQSVGKTVAILVADGFEQSEFESPRKALDDAGIRSRVISIKRDPVQAWKKGQWGDTFEVDARVEDVSVEEFNALLLPGGVMNPDKLRQNPRAVEFVRSFFAEGKPVAAICHGPQVLIDAEVVDGRKLTSYPSIRKDLENAGAEWVDEAVVVDQGLVTSRTPDDLPLFNQKLVEEVAEGRHAGQHA